MADKKWNDWTELYRTGKNLEPEAPGSKPLKKSKQTGKDVLGMNGMLDNLTNFGG